MARFYRRRKYCRFTAEGIKEIDYKDLEILKANISETGKIVRWQTDNGRQHLGRIISGQRMAAVLKSLVARPKPELPPQHAVDILLEEGRSL